MSLQTNTRFPAVAGQFYPDDPNKLKASVQSFLDNTKVARSTNKPLAMIVPHAGYIYSGSIAASAYTQLLPFAEQISRVILLGPSHRVPLLGIASSSHDYFQTPLGDIPLDREEIDRLKQLNTIQINDEAHLQEHSLEVQLPFLQKILPEFKLVPLVLGQVEDQQVGDLIDSLWGKSDTLFLISSDLSHFLDYDRAQKCDQTTCRAIEELNPQIIHYEQACGRSAIAGLLLSAKKHRLQVKTLDLRNSGDTAGTKERVVGYGAWSFC
jgi:MEMO1 family protein